MLAKIFSLGKIGCSGACKCGGCISGICATACGISVSGITFAVTNTSGFSGSCTTDVTGCCGVTIPAAGAYTVTPSGGLSSGESFLVHLGCGTTVFIDLGASNPADPDPPPPTFQCCFCVLPNVATLTDGNGSYAFTFNPATNNWQASTVIETPSLAAQPPPEGCFCPTEESGPLTILYTGTCNIATTPPTFTVTRQWRVGSCSFDPTNDTCEPPAFYLLDDATCAEILPNCPSSDITSFSVAPTCSPFVWSGTLTGTPATPDPVGGTVTVIA